MRNPWGTEKWMGKYKDLDEEADDQLKKQLFITDHDQGDFFIEIQEFNKYFDHLNVCCYEENF